jgi:hypothetical protein
MKQVICTMMGHETKTLRIGHENLRMYHDGTRYILLSFASLSKAITFIISLNLLLTLLP